MLSDAPVTPIIGVKDQGKAKEFYEGKLGLKPDESMKDMGGVLYDCGMGSKLFVYETEFGGTNKATAVSWEVDDIEAEMRDLRSKGVEFEDYDMPGLTTENGLAAMEGLKSAWFKDPDGNILSIMETS
jgi:catechol 2,3-dioxygenase-like lactoylglutathione lyase family enzyme